jgi:ribonuclease D
MQAMLKELRHQPVVAVDTESDSLYAYYYKVCLLQISVPGTDYLVDPLTVCDATPLGSLFANPKVEKVFHAAENDIVALKRDYGFAFANIFDTFWAARILGWSDLNLAAILKTKFGVRLDKRAQRTNWGRRPLTPQQLSYARLDSHYLLPLREMQIAELKAQRRMREARSAFARSAGVIWEDKPFDPDGFWRINGARDLPPQTLAVLKELYLWREERARQMDRPLFKVVGDKTLVEVAQEQPTTAEALGQIPGMSAGQVKRHGRGMLAAIDRGLRAEPPKPPARQRNNRTKRFDASAQSRYEALRSWRNARAAERGVEADVILSNEDLRAIALRAPRTAVELTEIAALDSWRRKAYGSELLEVLSGRKRRR